MRRGVSAQRHRLIANQFINQTRPYLFFHLSPHSRNFPFHLALFRPRKHKISPQTKRPSYSNCRIYCSLLAQLVQAQPETYNWNQRFRWLLRVPGVLDRTNSSSPSPEMLQVPSVLYSPKDLIRASWDGLANYVRKLLFSRADDPQPSY